MDEGRFVLEEGELALVVFHFEGFEGFGSLVLVSCGGNRGSAGWYFLQGGREGCCSLNSLISRQTRNGSEVGVAMSLDFCSFVFYKGV